MAGGASGLAGVEQDGIAKPSSISGEEDVHSVGRPGADAARDEGGAGDLIDPGGFVVSGDPVDASGAVEGMRDDRSKTRPHPLRAERGVGQIERAPTEGVHRVRQALARDLRLALTGGARREDCSGAAPDALTASRPARAGGRDGRRWSRLDPDILAWSLDAPDPTPAFVAEVIQLRLMVEPRAAGLAARLRTGPQLETMRQALTAMALHGLDGVAGRRAELVFHQAMFAATADRSLIHLGDGLACAMRLSVTRASGGARRPALADRWRVLDAIANQQPRDAQGAMARALKSALPGG
jgi:hypothetical protein